MFTTKPEEVSKKMTELLFEYNMKKEKTFDYLLDFHYKFECIHPFQDGMDVLVDFYFLKNP